jgi:hypothetical protein
VDTGAVHGNVLWSVRSSTEGAGCQAESAGGAVRSVRLGAEIRGAAKCCGAKWGVLCALGGEPRLRRRVDAGYFWVLAGARQRCGAARGGRGGAGGAGPIGAGRALCALGALRGAATRCSQNSKLVLPLPFHKRGNTGRIPVRAQWQWPRSSIGERCVSRVNVKHVRACMYMCSRASTSRGEGVFCFLSFGFEIIC